MSETVRVRYELPGFGAGEAEAIVREHYGLESTARPLPSERDQNFLVEAADGQAYVLKIANHLEEAAVLTLQNQALAHLAERAPGLALARVCCTLPGETMALVGSETGRSHLVRLLTYVPGRLWADTNPQTPRLLRSLGEVLGTVDAALQDFSHPAARRALKWDLAQAGWVRDYGRYIDDPTRRTLVERCLAAFQAEAEPRLQHLRQAVIYNDANDYNILVELDNRLDPRVVGLIDFGDMVHSYLVSELAVAAAYALMDQADPLAAAGHLVAGYHAAFPLTETELEVLFPLIQLRLCTTVANAAYQRRVEPGNDYLTISEAPAWALLEKLADIPSSLAHYSLRAACGLPPCPHTGAIQDWLAESAEAIGPVVEADLGQAVVFDLSVGSVELGNWPDITDPAALERNLFGRVAAEGAEAGIGRYGEAQPFYIEEAYQVEGQSGLEWRAIHLGTDLFVPPGSPVFAPLAGRVHRLQDNQDGPFASGPTVILEHTLPEGLVLYTLYAHLSRDSLTGLAEGQPIQRGTELGIVGVREENGGWPPHLHFQLITDLLDQYGDFPATARPNQKAVWQSLCPNPDLILRRPAEGLGRERLEAEQILVQRRQHLGRNLSLAYQRPLHIVRGYRQFLYSADGRAYLDAVNNIAHVGHNHPHVVRAGQAQMAVLNTNTRYLHENIVRLAERLCATLPEPLRVCYFVCSGSEANELALRLAQAHTGQRDMIVLDTAYHGNTSRLVDISPYKHNGPGGAGTPAGVHVVPMPDGYRGRYRVDDPALGQALAECYASHVAEAAAGSQGVSAFIAESVLSCGGQVVLPEGYLAAAYRHARAAGAVCIADEVQAGFGRVGTHFWAFETQGVVPDIVTIGKPMGNGHPLAAVITTPEIAASFDNGMEYFNSFGGNPVSCAIGLAVLDVMEREGLQAHAREVGQHLLEGLRGLEARHPAVGDVRGLGLFLGVELVRDPETRRPAGEQAGYVANRLRDHGILLSTDGPDHNVLKIKPPLVFTIADADRLVATLDKVLGEDFCQV